MTSLYLGPWAQASWDAARWPNFTARELACPCCGELSIRTDALDAIQRLREAMNAPLIIDSGHRCAIHNARIGGAPLSQHKSLAFDVRLAGHAPMVLRARARQCGFRGFGYGNTFLHLDVRARPAHWFYGKRSIEKWTSLGL
jgi:hypothetical protein